ncbi:protein UXT homolog [Watersipora subatra]|uniref:protein UXT homolog n=1 Tax=Watersipora subatra TaxID=2589382 RepID=UPI00355B4829
MAADKIRKFEEFVNERLRVDLVKVMESREKVAEQLAHYLQLEALIEQLQISNVPGEPLRTQVDLGCNFYAQAKVSDPSRICICIGMGYYVEFTLAEALLHIARRRKSLNQAADKLAMESAKIKAHIKTVLEGLREMQNIKSEEPQAHRSIW